MPRRRWKTKQQRSWQTLPSVLLKLSFVGLSPSELARCALVCASWRTHCAEPIYASIRVAHPPSVTGLFPNKNSKPHVKHIDLLIRYIESSPLPLSVYSNLESCRVSFNLGVKTGFAEKRTLTQRFVQDFLPLEHVRFTLVVRDAALLTVLPFLRPHTLELALDSVLSKTELEQIRRVKKLILTCRGTEECPEFPFLTELILLSCGFITSTILLMVPLLTRLELRASSIDFALLTCQTCLVTLILSGTDISGCLDLDLDLTVFTALKHLVVARSRSVVDVRTGCQLESLYYDGACRLLSSELKLKRLALGERLALGDRMTVVKLQPTVRELWLQDISLAEQFPGATDVFVYSELAQSTLSAWPRLRNLSVYTGTEIVAPQGVNLYHHQKNSPFLSNFISLLPKKQ